MFTKSQEIKNKKCFFCNEKARAQKILTQNYFWFSRIDDNPISPGHALIFPKRHIESTLDLSFLEFIFFRLILRKTWAILKEKHQPDGYNIGINFGPAAGQGHGHLHWHFIPRFSGDVPHDPQGGVRWVIPAKATESRKDRPSTDTEKTTT